MVDTGSPYLLLKPEFYEPGKKLARFRDEFYHDIHHHKPRRLRHTDCMILPYNTKLLKAPSLLIFCLLLSSYRSMRAFLQTRLPSPTLASAYPISHSPTSQAVVVSLTLTLVSWSLCMYILQTGLTSYRRPKIP
jgi:hypothetical protein